MLQMFLGYICSLQTKTVSDEQEMNFSNYYHVYPIRDIDTLIKIFMGLLIGF